MDERIAANRDSWDARTPVHVVSRFYDVEGWLRDAPGPRARETDVLGDVDDQTLVHLQCHIGLDTLQFARAGARAVGLDFSPAAIDVARDLARQTELDGRAEFVCADVRDAVAALGGRTFDVVYVSLGALCWLPSVDRWAEQAATLVAPGGRLYLHDGHPLSWALADHEARIEHTYFEEIAPYVDNSGLTYTDGVTEPIPHTFQWNHSIGETVSALVRHGLRLEWLEEHDWTVFQRFPWLVELPSPPSAIGAPRPERCWTVPPGQPRIPLSFTLLARRPDRQSRDDGPGAYRAVVVDNGSDASATPVVVRVRDELQAALDVVEPLLAGRTIDLEFASLQVLVEPASFRAELAALVESAVAATVPSAAITVRVARRGGSARVDVVVDGEGPRADEVVGTITIPLAPGASNSAGHG